MPDVIDPRYVDVDFSKEERFTFGCTGPGDTSLFADYEDTEELTPESKWPEEIAKMKASNSGANWLVTRIYDQKQEGSCVANACSQGMEIIQALQFGRPNVVHLSAMSLYKRIGSSPNSGANVSDGMKELEKRGVLPLDTPENRAKFGDKVMPNTGWGTKYPEGWEQAAAGFVLVEAKVIRSTRAMVDAGLKRRPVIVGRNGHSICYTEPTYIDGQLGYDYGNSWRIDWGQPRGYMTGGFGHDSRRTVEASAQWAFALCAIVVRN